MVDYEKGTPAWDIGQILTRHDNGTHKAKCQRVDNLQNTAFKGLTPQQRLTSALATPCTCGAGESGTETTSHRKGQMTYGGAATATGNGISGEEGPSE